MMEEPKVKPNMFCFQCQEAARGTGCDITGNCGKRPFTAQLQDELIYVAKGISIVRQEAAKLGLDTSQADTFVMDSLFVTITNANFDNDNINARINRGIELREYLKLLITSPIQWPEIVNWRPQAYADNKPSPETSILYTANEDIRSLKELLTYGIKGMAAYAHHAAMLDFNSNEVFDFMHKGLVATTREDIGADELTGLVLECGKYGVQVMALLDEANTSTYGHPEITKVNIGVGENPGILVSGHDLKDMEQLLEQTEGTGIDVYTHSEMLPANYYPKFKKYKHFVGNYGNAWWSQGSEFEKFNGPILMTTNCIVPPRETYKNRIFTTGVVGFSGLQHIADGADGQPKDFSPLINLAKSCPPPTEIETGEIVGGFAHNQVMALADDVVNAVKTGAIKQFFVMAGCDGRMKGRDYYTQFADTLPTDTVILTAGCAKYRYNKLELGTINGIPRVLDAGQCNDSYSLAVIALKLKEVFELNDINDLPIAYNIAWYEQKAVIVLLALLHLGVKNIKLGPTLPAFLSPNVANILVETFGISGITEVDEDMKQMILEEV